MSATAARESGSVVRAAGRDSEPPALLLLRTSDHRLGVMNPPLGLLYLAAAVRERCRPPWSLSLLDLGLVGEAWPQRLASVLESLRPAAVGLSSLAHEANLARQAGRLVRERTAGWPRPPLVLLGGPFPTSSPELAIAQGAGWLDGLLVGEGELALPALLDRYAGELAAERGSMASRAEGGSRSCDQAGRAAAEARGTEPGEPVDLRQRRAARCTRLFRGLRGWHTADGRRLGGPASPAFERADPQEELDALPLPAWDLLPPGPYAARPNWNGMLKGRPYMPVLTSRGCPYGCTYCHRIFGRRVRLHGPERVVEELALLGERHGVREVHITDDIFNIDPQRARAICEGIVRRGLRLHLAFPNGIRGDLVDRGLLESMRRAGTYKISYGIETASPRLQQETGKNLDLAKAERAIRDSRRLGMIPAGFFMLGFPGETREEIRRTIDFAVGSALLTAKFFQVIPYPGTALGRSWSAGESGKFAGERLSQYHFLSSEVTCSELDPRELNDYIAQAYLRFFGRPGRVLALLRRHPRPIAALRDLRRLHGTLLRYRWRRLAPPSIAREGHRESEGP